MNITEYKRKYQSRKEFIYYENIFKSPGEQIINELEMLVLNKILNAHSYRRLNYLDLACGFGRIIFALSSRFKNSLGIDSSGEMIAEAKKRLKRTRSRNIKFKLMDISNIKLKTKFDFITLFRFLKNIDEKNRLVILKEIYRVTNDDGLFICHVSKNRHSFHGIVSYLKSLFLKIDDGTMALKDARKELYETHWTIEAIYGVKLLPFFSYITFLPKAFLLKLELKFGQLPILKYFCDSFIIVARKKPNYT